MVVREDDVRRVGEARVRQEAEGGKDGLATAAAAFERVRPQDPGHSVEVGFAELVQLVVPVKLVPHLQL